jgi:hypothetical protein
MQRGLAVTVPELADSLEATLRNAGYGEAADSIPSLVITDGVTSSSKAELAFDGELRVPVQPAAAEGLVGRTRYWVYVEDITVKSVTLQNLAQFRQALRRLCEPHESFDWDAYYRRD